MAEHIFGSTRRHLRSKQKFCTFTFTDRTQHYVDDCLIANLPTQMLFGFLEMPLTNLDICLSAVLSYQHAKNITIRCLLTMPYVWCFWSFESILTC